MKNPKTALIFGLLIAIVTFSNPCLLATDYYVHPEKGDDAASGLSRQSAWQSLARASSQAYQPGDRLLLSNEVIHRGSLQLSGIKGAAGQHVLIEPYGPIPAALATIRADHHNVGILIENGAYIRVRRIRISIPQGPEDGSGDMTCGVLIQTTEPGAFGHIELQGLQIRDVFHNPSGFQRNENEVRTANGTGKYGWGIRCMIRHPEGALSNVVIADCSIEHVAHTGIKCTGHPEAKIDRLSLTNNHVSHTGGPGLQFSRVRDLYVADNEVSYSGSSDDPRKWGRGSGLWTWGTDDAVIERNRFSFARGPGDSAGAHIDFNCSNVILQYNVSYRNAGGFCEILGNNHNSVYRYNISIDDGYRVKGKDGAFQDGKTFWLSGYVGNNIDRKGPFNSYFYNNTIYVSDSIVSKIAISPTSRGILIANNIFYVRGESKLVRGDQDQWDDNGEQPGGSVHFANNLFLHPNSWPVQAPIQDADPAVADVDLQPVTPFQLFRFLPDHIQPIRDKGKPIHPLSSDRIFTASDLQMPTDILGNPIIGEPDLGAIELEALQVIPKKKR
jgi:hypothetical protein